MPAVSAQVSLVANEQWTARTIGRYSALPLVVLIVATSLTHFSPSHGSTLSCKMRSPTKDWFLRERNVASCLFFFSWLESRRAGERKKRESYGSKSSTMHFQTSALVKLGNDWGGNGGGDDDDALGLGRYVKCRSSRPCVVDSEGLDLHGVEFERNVGVMRCLCGGGQFVQDTWYETEEVQEVTVDDGCDDSMWDDRTDSYGDGCADYVGNTDLVRWLRRFAISHQAKCAARAEVVKHNNTSIPYQPATFCINTDHNNVNSDGYPCS